MKNVASKLLTGTHKEPVTFWSGLLGVGFLVLIISPTCICKNIIIWGKYDIVRTICQSTVKPKLGWAENQDTDEESVL